MRTVLLQTKPSHRRADLFALHATQPLSPSSDPRLLCKADRAGGALQERPPFRASCADADCNGHQAHFAVLRVLTRWPSPGLQFLRPDVITGYTSGLSSEAPCRAPDQTRATKGAPGLDGAPPAASRSACDCGRCCHILAHLVLPNGLVIPLYGILVIGYVVGTMIPAEIYRSYSARSACNTMWLSTYCTMVAILPPWSS